MRIAIVLLNYQDALILLEEITQKDILFELRLDSDPSLLKLIYDKLLDANNCIITVRSHKEGGFSMFTWNDFLDEVVKLNPAYIDLELNKDLHHIPFIYNNSESKIIVSVHDYHHPMKRMSKEILKKFDWVDADLKSDRIVTKVVGKPIDFADYIIGHKQLLNYNKNQIILGLGAAGEIGRTRAIQLKQHIVYGGYNFPLIMDYNRVIETNKSDSIILGLLGGSIDNSLSPQIHHHLLEKNNLSGYYHLFEIKEKEYLGEAFEFFKSKSIVGINVTVPYKRAALEYVDKMSKDVELIGATNTIKFNSDTIAENTDITGFTSFLKRNHLDNYQSALVVGAGGVGRAATVALMNMGKEVTVVNRRWFRKNEFGEDIRADVDYYDIESFKRFKRSNDISSELFINATSLPDPTTLIPIPDRTGAVVDLNYSIGKTKLIEIAENNTYEAYDGKEMLICQAVDAFKIWTDVKFDEDKVVSEILAKFSSD